MYRYTLANYKTVIDSNTYLNQLKAENSKVLAYEDTGENLKVDCVSSLLQGEIDALNLIQPAPRSAYENIEEVIVAATEFGRGLIIEASTENVLLGITQYGMTNTVRKRLAEVNNALNTGSLYDAIFEIREIPEEQKDGIFISDQRLLSVINKIENYLGLPISTEV